MDTSTNSDQAAVAPQLPLHLRPPASPPKAEDDLDVALNGQEPTVKNLIMAAIGVMKVTSTDTAADSDFDLFLFH